MAEPQGTSQNNARVCSWCGCEVAAGEVYRLLDEPGERHAVFCRLEHVVPWAMRGAHWTAGPAEIGVDPSEPAECARCGRALDAARLVIVHDLGEHRVSDSFCSVDHASAWAKDGGRYAAP